MQINIRANWQGAKNGMNAVLGHAKGLGSKLSGALGGVKNALGSVAGMLGVGLGAAAAVRGISNLIDKMDEIEDNAPKLGVTFDYFQRMQFAAERSGTSFSAVTSAFTRVKKLSAEAAAGVKTGVDAFAMLGMSVEQIRGMDTGQIFDEITLRLNSMNDPLLRDAAAVQFFGKNFTELNNYLKDHIALGDELAERGGIIKDEHILAASAYKDAITNIGTALQAWAVNSGFISQITALAQGLDAIASNAARMESSGITEGDGFLKGAARKGIDMFSRGTTVGNIATMTANLITGDDKSLSDRLLGAETMSTAAIDRASPEYAEMKARGEAQKNRAAEVNSAAAREAAINAAVTARSRKTELKALEDLESGEAATQEKKIKAKSGVKELSDAQGAMSPSAKIIGDSLQRIGGYSVGSQARGADFGKKQVDLLTAVDKKMEVIANAARDGGLLFP